MADPKSDPTALLVRWMDTLERSTALVVDVPSLADARTLSDGTDAALRYVCRDYEVAHALIHAGFDAEHAATLTGPAEAVILYLPKGKERVDMTVRMAASVLELGSPLWLVGPKRGGVESAARLLAEVAAVEDVASGKHCKLARATCTESRSVTLDDFAQSWTLPAMGSLSRTLEICSFPGVFGHGRLDDGTAMLLGAVEVGDGPLADVGCGAGVIGAWYAAQGLHVHLGDADAFAVEASRRTLEMNGLTGKVSATNGLSKLPGPFAQIVSNPPFHKGFATDHTIAARIIAAAPAELSPGGTLTLVVNRFLKIPDPLEAAFGGFEVLMEDRRFRVYRASRA